MTQTLLKWNKTDGTKLQSLFWKAPRRGGASSVDLSQRNIELVHAKHCPEQPYQKFFQLFCKKARQWNINHSLLGKVVITVMIVLVLLFSACFLSDHLLLCLLASGQEASQVVTESEENRGQEDIGEAGGALTDTEEEAEDTSPQDVDNPQDMDKEEQQEDSIDSLTKTFGMMTPGSTALATKDAFSMDFAFPYIMYYYEAKNCKVVTADFLIVGMNESFLHPKVNQDSTELHVQVTVPPLTPRMTILLLQNGI